MNIEQLFQQIKKNKPKLVYLSGKTSVGKTTFSNKLHKELNYDQVELDEIVMKSVVEKYKLKEQAEAYVVVYRDGGPGQWRQSFIEAANKDISKAAQGKHLVIEGAIANNDTLRSVFSGDLKEFMFVYFHPTDKQAYIDRINKRLVAGVNNGEFGLPKSFWSLLPQGTKEEYTSTGKMTKIIEEAVDKYIDQSIEESKNRLEMFQKSFSNITIVDV